MRIRGGRRLAVAVSALVMSSACLLTPAGASPERVADTAPLLPGAYVGPVPVETTPTLGCVMTHRDDRSLSFYSTTVLDGSGGVSTVSACGTFVAVGGQLYGPHGTPAMFGAKSGDISPELQLAAPGVLTPITQSALSGSGTDAEPYQVVTRVMAGTTGIELVQTDQWTYTSEAVRTRIDVFNRSRQRRTVSLYRAADCQADAHESFGRIGIGRAACLVAAYDGPGHEVARLVPGDAIIELQGAASTAVVDIHDQAGLGAAIAGPMTRGERLRQTCVSCDGGAADRSLALGWRLSIGSGRSVTVRTSTTISTGEARPISSIAARLDPNTADTISATLTSGGRGLRARTLRFLRDGTEVCRALTDRSGRATCVATMPEAVGDPAAGLLGPSSTVDVMFDGELDIRPSFTWVEVGAPPADPGPLPAAPGCVPAEVRAFGPGTGATTVLLTFAEASCPSVRYAVIADDGIHGVRGDGSPRLELRFATSQIIRLVLARFRQSGTELYSYDLVEVSPGKAIG